MSPGLSRKLAARIERYQFEVGILENKDRREPMESPIFGAPPETRVYAGGPVRKLSTVKSTVPNSEIFISNQQRLNINLLTRPFDDKSSDIMKFVKTFFMIASGGKTSLKRLENLLQAVVRNPILRQEYGKNRSSTADAKGFDRHLFDTGQMFKAIKARVKRV